MLVENNAPCHAMGNILHTHNNVQFLPPNVTTLIQPSDEGIARAIKCIKCQYRTQIVRQLVIQLNGK